MAAKQANLLKVVKQFKDDAQDIVKKTQGQFQDLVVKTQKDIVKLAANNPQIKKLVARAEAEQKRYEKVLKDVQNKALKLYKDRAQNIISDIKGRIDGYRKQAEKLYKDARTKKLSSVKSKASAKTRKTRKKRTRKVRIVQSGNAGM